MRQVLLVHTLQNRVASLLLQGPVFGEGAVLDLGDQFPQPLAFRFFFLRLEPARHLLAVLARPAVQRELPEQPVRLHHCRHVGRLARHPELQHGCFRADARLHQHVVGPPQGVEPAGVLVEEVAEGLLIAARLDAAAFEGAHGLRQRQHHRLRVPGRIVLHAHQAGEAGAIQEGLAHAGADGAGGDHQHVDVGRVAQEAVGDVVAAGNDDSLARLQMRPDVPVEHRGHDLVGDEQEVVVGMLDRTRDVVGLEAVGDGLLERCVADVADDDRGAVIAHVERLRPPLVAVTQYTDGLVLQQVQIAVIFEVDLGHPVLLGE